MTEKKRKGSRRWVVISVILLVLCIAAGALWMVPLSVLPVQGNPYQAALPQDHLLTARQVQEDCEQCIRMVEETHPYFLLEADLTAYEAAKARYLAAASGEMTVGDLEAATAEFLCFFGDGHTGVRLAETEVLNLPQVYKDGRTWLCQEGEANGVWVETIGGVPVETIYQTIDRLVPAENQMAQTKNREQRIVRRGILQRAGVEIADNQTVVCFSDGTETAYAFEVPETATAQTTSNGPVNRWYMDGDVFVVDFNACNDDEELKAIAAELKKAVEADCRKVIIDVRGNGGGNSNACTRLLSAMDMDAPQYDMLVRYSPLARQQRGYLRTDGQFHFRGSNMPVKRNEQVRLAVLCDRDTFSSATMMCVYVRDGGHGVLIGEPSSNMPSAYGDILSFSLTHSHVNGIISHKQFIRPDENNTERMLLPDVLVDPVSAYEAAMQWLAQ